MTSFCRAANFRQLLQTKTLPDFLMALIPVIQSFFGRNDLRSTLMTDVVSSDDPEFLWDTTATSETLPYDTYQLLLSRINSMEPMARFTSYYHREPGLQVLDPTVQKRQKLEHNGTIFRPCPNTHPIGHRKLHGDSLIQFMYMGRLQTGKITDIFIHNRTVDHVVGFFAVVDVFGELTEAETALDPYRRYPLLEVKLCRTDVSQTVVIDSSDIVSHFASCPYSNGYQVVVSLDRSGKLNLNGGNYS
jgi:hypothetical protein